MERRSEQSQDSLLWNVKRKKMERTIHYIWINWVSSKGSESSRLISNRSMPVSDAKEMILRTSAKELLKHRPSWLKDCVRISVSAQDITTGEILYRRTINIKKKEIEKKKRHLRYFLSCSLLKWY